ncbi:hypothetical protein CDAR_248261 [Caerostris darwini]|uniref:Uncharacterized protein n=1 Tax=Caerostris darwini TaxID=1538125 RepID=A0AAV4TNA6_9ARAC|nr:hypothetical protein CDAR_248261 [Caerostris darwini]
MPCQMILEGVGEPILKEEGVGQDSQGRHPTGRHLNSGPETIPVIPDGESAEIRTSSWIKINYRCLMNCLTGSKAYRSSGFGNE